MKYTPVTHDKAAFLKKAMKRPGFKEAFDDLDLEFQLVNARSHAGLTQDAVAEKMGTTKSAVSRLESGGKHAPSLTTLKKYAAAVGCELQVALVRMESH